MFAGTSPEEEVFFGASAAARVDGHVAEEVELVPSENQKKWRLEILQPMVNQYDYGKTPLIWDNS